MKKVAIVILLLLGSMATAQEAATPDDLEVPSNMKQYFVAFLVENSRSGEKVQHKILKAHLALIRSNIESGKLVVAGPFTDNDRVAGILIMNAASQEEAQQILSADPIVKTGHVSVEIHPAMLPDLSSLKVQYPPKKTQ